MKPRAMDETYTKMLNCHSAPDLVSVRFLLARDLAPQTGKLLERVVNSDAWKAIVEKV